MPPKKNFSVNVYVYKVLKQVHPEIGISKQAMQTMNSFVFDISKQILREAEKLTIRNNTFTVAARHIATAVFLILPGELAKHSQAEGHKCVQKFRAASRSMPLLGSGKGKGKVSGKGGGGGRGGSRSQSSRAGLQFPVGRYSSWMRRHTGKETRIGAAAPVYLTSVVEYLTAELLELSGNAAKDNRRSRIVPRHIMLAVRTDDELGFMLRDITIPLSGVIPHIHAALMPDRKKAKPKKKKVKKSSKSKKASKATAVSTSSAAVFVPPSPPLASDPETLPLFGFGASKAAKKSSSASSEFKAEEETSVLDLAVDSIMSALPGDSAPKAADSEAALADFLASQPMSMAAFTMDMGSEDVTADLAGFVSDSTASPKKRTSTRKSRGFESDLLADRSEKATKVKSKVTRKKSSSSKKDHWSWGAWD